MIILTESLLVRFATMAILRNSLGISNEVLNIVENEAKVGLFSGDLGVEILSIPDDVLDIINAGGGEFGTLVAISLGSGDITLQLFEVVQNSNNLHGFSVRNQMHSITNNILQIGRAATFNSHPAEVAVLLGFGHITHDLLNISEELGEIGFSRGGLGNNVLGNFDDIFDISDTGTHIGDSKSGGAVSLSGLDGGHEALNVSQEFGEVESFSISDDIRSSLDDRSEVTGAVLDITNLGELAISLSFLDIRGDGLNILKELGEIGLAGLGLGNDILDHGDHVFDIAHAGGNVVEWFGELAVLLGGRNIRGNLGGVLQDLGKVRRGRLSLGDDIFGVGIEIVKITEAVREVIDLS
jgi:hypothetical protein